MREPTVFEGIFGLLLRFEWCLFYVCAFCLLLEVVQDLHGQ